MGWGRRDSPTSLPSRFRREFKLEFKREFQSGMPLSLVGGVDWSGRSGSGREGRRAMGGRAWQDVDWKSRRALVIFRGEFVGRGRYDR